MQRWCSVLGPPPVDTIVDALRSLFESQSEHSEGQRQQAAELQRKKGQVPGAPCRALPSSNPAGTATKQHSRHKAEVRWREAGATSLQSDAQPAEATCSARSSHAQAHEGKWQRQPLNSVKSRGAAAGSALSHASQGSSCQPAIPLPSPMGSSPSLPEAVCHRMQALSPEQTPERCLTADTPTSQGSEQTMGTVKLYIGTKRGGGHGSALRDAHVQFQEKLLVVQAVDCNGKTWNFRSALPGPIVADECRYGVCKTGKEVSISLKKADETEEWQVKDRICFGEDLNDDTAVLSLKADSNSAQSRSSESRCDFLVTPAKEMLANDGVQVYKGMRNGVCHDQARDNDLPSHSVREIGRSFI
mmetsp:Transcript_64856/g.154853  ORF Transcript_64856/g.154853 Transcript_64856/m.154853 type:complete len:359 (+) Transcript_64856:175-1251(+)